MFSQGHPKVHNKPSKKWFKVGVSRFVSVIVPPKISIAVKLNFHSLQCHQMVLQNRKMPKVQILSKYKGVEALTNTKHASLSKKEGQLAVQKCLLCFCISAGAENVFPKMLPIIRPATCFFILADQMKGFFSLLINLPFPTVSTTMVFWGLKHAAQRCFLALGLVLMWYVA